MTPDEFKRNAHHWLLLHGRYVCIARLPACPKCIIADLCEYELKTPPKDLPKSDAPVAHAKNAAPVVARGAGKKVATSPRAAGRAAEKPAAASAAAKRSRVAARTRSR